MTMTRTPRARAWPWATALSALSLACTLAVTGSVAIPASAHGQDDVGPDPHEAFDEFDPSAFAPDSHVVDNRYLPLVPGTRSIWTGSAIHDDERVRRRIVTTVTDLTKQIGGVNALVVLERDYNDGELIESELAFRAQDTDGNVWHLGEYTELWDDGEFIGGQAWMQGHLEGARAGIIMQADPKPDRPSYAQGWAPPPYYWTDRGLVVAMGESVSEVAGDFDDVLVVAEFDASEPDAQQLKYYAPDVGLVSVGYAGDDEEREQLGLLLVERLDEAAMEGVRGAVREHETRAYVYATTDPAAPMATGDS